MTESSFSRGLRCAVLTVAALSAAPAAFSQAAPAYPKTVDIFGGGSYNEAFTPSSHQYGWDASGTERPYLTHPWVGGTIEVSGAYTSASASGSTATSSSQFYTAMCGPVFVVNANRIQPFGRVLLGTGLRRVPGNGTVVSTNTAHFAFSAGGGVDVPISSFWAVRAQADLVRTYAAAGMATNMLRASVGLDLRF